MASQTLTTTMSDAGGGLAPWDTIGPPASITLNGNSNDFSDSILCAVDGFTEIPVNASLVGIVIHCGDLLQSEQDDTQFILQLWNDIDGEIGSSKSVKGGDGEYAPADAGTPTDTWDTNVGIGRFLVTCGVLLRANTAFDGDVIFQVGSAPTMTVHYSTPGGGTASVTRRLNVRAGDRRSALGGK